MFGGNTRNNTCRRDLIFPAEREKERGQIAKMCHRRKREENMIKMFHTAAGVETKSKEDMMPIPF